MDFKTCCSASCNMFIYKLLSKLIFILFPIIIPITISRILASPKVITWEYKRSTFPSDRFGFITNQRIKYGTMFPKYLFSNKNISYLKDLKSTDGNSLFREEELSHMEDVKIVIKKIQKWTYLFLFIFIISLLMLIIKKESRIILLKNLYWSSITSSTVIILLIVSSIISFSAFFNLFHKFLGFEENTWVFYESDTLIRLFPIKYWIDMFIILVSSTLSINITLSLICKFLIKFNKN